MDMKKKLTSRKFWACVAGVVSGLAMVFGLDENVISSVAGAVMSAASIVTYILMEGKIDAESAKVMTIDWEDLQEGEIPSPEATE